MTITILVDNKASWILPYAKQLAQELGQTHAARLAHTQEDIAAGDCAFFLGCEKLVSSEVLKRNTHNIVIHESALPQGKGWSPLTWQILEGKNDIPITLFEAEQSVDSGDVYLRDELHFDGHELNDELKKVQGEKTIALVKEYLAKYPGKGRPQEGKETFYSRRTPADSEFDPNKTIAEQFNLLRVVDNDRYPAFFHYRGKKYFLKIYTD